MLFTGGLQFQGIGRGHHQIMLLWRVFLYQYNAPLFLFDCGSLIDLLSRLVLLFEIIFLLHSSSRHSYEMRVLRDRLDVRQSQYLALWPVMLALASKTALAAVFAVANARIVVHLWNVFFKLACTSKTTCRRTLGDLRARRQEAHTLTRCRLDGRRSAHGRIPTGILMYR